MFLAPSDYRTVFFNTERQYVLVPVDTDPKELASGLIADTKYLLDLFKQVLVEYRGEGEKKRAMLVPVPDKELIDARAFIDSSRENEKFLWETLISPLIYKEHAYSRHKDAPSWHLEWMERFSLLYMIVITFGAKNSEFDDFRSLELTTRVIKGNASVGPGMMYGRAWRVLKGYSDASGMCSGADPYGYESKNDAIALAKIMGSCLGSYCSGDCDWFHNLVKTWDTFCETTETILVEAIARLTTDVEHMESGEFFEHVKVIPRSMFDMVMYFAPPK